MTATFAPDRNELLERVDLPAVLTELVGPRATTGWPCPNRDHAQTGKTPPVSVRGDGTGLWKCHGCGAGGTAIDVLMLTMNIGVAEAFTELRRRAGSTPPRRTPPPPKRRPERQVNPQAAGRVLDSFLAARRWTPEVAARFGLHVVLDSHGQWRVRLPFRHAGEVIWHQDRLVSGFGPKFVAPTGSKSVLYAHDLAESMNAATELGCAVIVEGPADVIAIDHALTSPAVFGVPGVGMPLDRWVPAFAGLAVTLIADNDDAGERFRHTAGAALTDVGCDVLQVRVPDGHNDVDDWRRAHEDDETFGVSVLEAFDVAAGVAS